MTTELTEMEIRQVYALAMAYDNRKLSEANITAWWEQASRNRWTFDEAREAIHEHHRNSTEFLMPGHVTAIIRAGRRQPEKFSSDRLLPAAPPAQPERIKAVVDTIAKRLRWNREQRQRHDDPALAVPCAHPPCRAGVGVPCSRLITSGTHKGERRALANPHPTRVEAAQSHPQEQR